MTVALLVSFGVLLLVALTLSSLLRFHVVFSDHGGLFRLHWLALTLGFDTAAKEWQVLLFSRRVYRKQKDERPAKPKDKEPKERRQQPVRAWFGDGKAFWGVLRYLLRHIRLEHVYADATLATPDPALTGTLYGLAASVVYPLAALSPKVQLNVTADFVGDRPSGRVDAALGIRLVYLIVFGWQVYRLTRRRRAT